MLDMIAMLEPFERAIKKFEASKVPTIQHVIPRYKKLKKHLQPKEDDSDVMAQFRTVLLRELEEKIPKNITMRHKMGLFFWPKFASLPNTPNDERAEVCTILYFSCCTTTSRDVHCEKYS